ncbi:hypothetical protein [Gemella cuniculi]|uniref:hypothetical protein n=1 Tax=Gemella cuniculi TaxID=150240 RepID=UPI0003F810B1|nr:hypothetical protein [Gemella cuniculi]
MLKKWFKLVNKELENIIKKVEPFEYGNIIGYLIQLAGIAFIVGGIYYFYAEEKVTYFARIGSILVGILLSIIGKVLISIMAKKSSKKLFLAKIANSLLDSFLWTTVISLIFYEIIEKRTNFNLSEYALIDTIGFFTVYTLIVVIKYILYKKKLINKTLALYIGIMALPLRIIFIFVKKKYRLFVLVVFVASILLLTMILLAFQVGEIISTINPFKSFNVYYPVMVIFMILSDKLVTFIIPKTGLWEYFGHKGELAKIFMTWGIIIAMAFLYMFDWKLLMSGTDGWNESDKNTVLWAFTTYRLLATMLEDKFNILKNNKLL